MLAGRWNESRFPDWDDDLVDRLLTDSPWARPWKGYAIQPDGDQHMTSSWSQVGTGLPPRIPGIGWPRVPGPGSWPRSGDSDGMIRVAVELTLRWASALPVRRAMVLAEFGRLRLDHPRAVEMLSTQPGEFVMELAGLPYRLVDEGFKRDMQKTNLIVPGNRPLSPLSVDFHSVGAYGTATLKFKRVADLKPDGKAEVLIQAGTLRIEEKFKLRPMIYEGRLEL
jgi:hypothetical protein